MSGQLSMFGDDREYQAFVDKFKPKKTTDDCYTPEIIYEAVAGWVAREYGLDRSSFVRPFWPGGDYERYDYPDGCVVVDNPPFSILANIRRFYIRRGIRFFLFAPTMTLFSGRGIDVTYIAVGITTTYENGANVNTSFVTNLDDCRVRSAPALYRAVRRANDENKRRLSKTMPRYAFPAHVLTAAAAYQYSHYGVDFRVEKRDATFVPSMDAMRGAGKSGIFGGAYLLSDRAAAERAAAERAAAERAAAERARALHWRLSERERRAVREMSRRRYWFVIFCEEAIAHEHTSGVSGAAGDFGDAVRGVTKSVPPIP